MDVYDFEYVLEHLSEEKYQYNKKFEIVMDAIYDGYGTDDHDNLWDLYARFSNVLQKSTWFIFDWLIFSSR